MVHNIIMPDLGQTVAEGKILRWLKRPGDHVGKGEALLEVETDKVTMEVESYRSGFLRAILVSEGQMASAMSPVAVVSDQADEALRRDGDREGMVPTAGSNGSTVESAALQVGPIPRSVPAAQGHFGRVPASPAAKLFARDHGIDLRTVIASRPDGLIIRRDVARGIGTHAVLKAAHPMAAITTKSAQTIPHFYATVDCDMAAALAWRNRWNSDHLDSRLSLNDLFVRAASLALRDLSAMNVRYSDGMILQKTAADILLVVATETRGLAWIPVAEPAALDWQEHARHMRAMLKVAENGSSLPALAEAPPALAVSNLGMFGVRQFTAIIPPDSAAILAIGAVREEPVIREGQIEIGQRCALTLASDHRVVDGVTAARFLEALQSHLKSL